MCRLPIDKTQLSTPNTRTQFYLGSANVNESIGDEPQMNADKNGINASENDGIGRTNTVTNDERDVGRDLASDRNYFGSMVSINEDFNPDVDATPKKTE